LFNIYLILYLQAGLSSNTEKNSQPSKTNLSTAFSKKFHSDITSKVTASSNGSLTSALSELLKKQTLNEPSETKTDSEPAFNFSVPKSVPVFDVPKTENDISEAFWNDVPVTEDKENTSKQEEKKISVHHDEEDLDFLLSLDRHVMPNKEETIISGICTKFIFFISIR
jgi:hypothetical protein